MFEPEMIEMFNRYEEKRRELRVLFHQQEMVKYMDVWAEMELLAVEIEMLGNNAEYAQGEG